MVTVITACAVSATENPGPQLPGLGAVAAEIKISDVRWLLAQSQEMATAVGIEPTQMSDLLAKILLRCRSFAGLDPSRPAYLGVRTQRQSLALLLPISRRSDAVEQLGEGADGQAPLVRTGDKGGAMILTQTAADGPVEYHALAGDQWLALAADSEECKRMIAAAPLHSDGPPLQIRIDPRTMGGDFSPLGWNIVRSALPRRMRLPESFPLELPLPSLLWSNRPAGEILNQMSDLRITCESAGPGLWRIRARATPVADSTLAGWVSAQRNASETISTALSRGGGWFSAVVNAVWQDQLGSLTAADLQRQQHRMGSRWDDSATTAAQVISAAIDRTTAFGWARGWAPGTMLGKIWQAEIFDHTGAAALAGASAVLAALEVPVGAELPHLDLRGTAGVVYPCQLPTGSGGAVSVANDQRWYWIASDSLTATAAAMATAQRIVSNPEHEEIRSVPLMARAEWRIDNWLEPLITSRRGRAIRLRPANIAAELTIDNGDIVVTATVPIQAMLETLGAAELAPTKDKPTVR